MSTPNARTDGQWRVVKTNPDFKDKVAVYSSFDDEVDARTLAEEAQAEEDILAAKEQRQRWIYSVGEKPLEPPVDEPPIEDPPVPRPPAKTLDDVCTLLEEIRDALKGKL